MLNNFDICSLKIFSISGCPYNRSIAKLGSSRAQFWHSRGTVMGNPVTPKEVVSCTGEEVRGKRFGGRDVCD